MNFEIEGRIIEIFPVEQITDSFRKREFVIEHIERVNDREFTDYVRFQLIQDRCEILDKFKSGQDVKVSFNLRGRKYEKNGEIKYFTNIEAWRVEAKQVATAQVPPLPDDYELPPAGDEDDLPF